MNHLYIIFFYKKLYSIACSRSIQDKYKEIGIDTDLVENGVKFPEIIGDKRIKSGRKFLYVGELIKRKNLTFLIKIFKNLPEFDLILVGSRKTFTKFLNKKEVNYAF